MAIGGKRELSSAAIPQEVAVLTLEKGAFEVAASGLWIACQSPSVRNAAKLENLSPTEYRVLDLASQGLQYDVVGEELHISETTVKTHQKNTYGKLASPDTRLKKLHASTFIPLSALEVAYYRRRFLRQAPKSSPDRLSGMELAVFEDFTPKGTDSWTAVRLGIEESTVRTHRANAAAKMGIASREYLIRLAGANRNLVRLGSSILQSHKIIY